MLPYKISLCFLLMFLLHVASAQQATADLGRVSSQANGLIADVQSRHFPRKIDETMTSVKSAVSNLDASAQQIHQTITEVADPDEHGETAGMNIRESLSNANPLPVTPPLRP